MSQQFLAVGEGAKRAIKKQIESEDYAPLGVWRYIKGNDSVLMYTGALANGWTYRFFRQAGGAVVGIRVMPKGMHPSGLSMAKIASILHDGVSFVPSEAQRRFLAARAKEAGAPPATGNRKEIWTIPPRPFLHDAIISKPFIERVQRQSARALRRTFDELKRG